MAEYRPNPAHQRAKRLCPTNGGREAVDRIRPGHAAFADRLADALGFEELRAIADALVRLAAVLDELLSSDHNPGDT